MGSGGMAEVPTIFYPKRSRAPSVVLSDDQANHGLTHASQIIHESGKISVSVYWILIFGDWYITFKVL